MDGEVRKEVGGISLTSVNKQTDTIQPTENAIHENKDEGQLQSENERTSGLEEPLKEIRNDPAQMNFGVGPSHKAEAISITLEKGEHKDTQKNVIEAHKELDVSTNNSIKDSSNSNATEVEPSRTIENVDIPIVNMSEESCEEGSDRNPLEIPGNFGTEAIPGPSEEKISEGHGKHSKGENESSRKTVISICRLTAQKQSEVDNSTSSQDDSSLDKNPETNESEQKKDSNLNEETQPMVIDDDDDDDTPDQSQSKGGSDQVMQTEECPLPNEESSEPPSEDAGSSKPEDSGRPVIVPRAFASMNSQREQTKFVNAAVGNSEQSVEESDPFEQTNGIEETDSPETITGDKSLAVETVLADPEIDVCIVEGEKGIMIWETESNRIAVREEHAYTLPPSVPSTSKDADNTVLSNDPGPPRKKLKVMYPKKRKNPSEIITSQVSGVLKTCIQCSKTVICRLMIEVGGENYFLCSDKCLMDHRNVTSATLHRVSTQREEQNSSVERRCAECSSLILPVQSEKMLTWQAMDFCFEDCLAKHQNKLGGKCAHCTKDVPQISLGKYCVRFGHKIRQFCSSGCLEEFKKGLKVCSYCQRDIGSANEGFLAPIGEKGTFKDFCSQECMDRYDCMSQNLPIQLSVQICDVCDKQKLVQVEVLYNDKTYKLCSDVCFAAFKFVNSIREGFCDMCKKFYNKTEDDEWKLIWEDMTHNFCSKDCMNIYILAKRKIVPCNWCKVKKYNFDMIKRSFVVTGGGVLMMCSLNCLALYQVSLAATVSKKIVCDKCKKLEPVLYHLTMSDATVRNFCSYQCVLNFQIQFKKVPITLPANYPTPTGAPKRILPKLPNHPSEQIIGSPPLNQNTPKMPVISSVGSLAKSNGPSQHTNETPSVTKTSSINVTSQIKIKHMVLLRPPVPPDIANKMTQVMPKTQTKATACKPVRASKSTQTDEPENREPALIPVPVPIYVPVPLAMYSIPCPTPMPFPIPIPVPVFVPTTRNSAQGILKEIKRIQDQIPDDPFEAELLMMAEMVASDKKDGTSSDSDPESTNQPNQNSGNDEGVEERGSSGEGADEYSPEDGEGTTAEDEPTEDDVVGDVEGNGGFGDDVIQMALKMATELEQQQQQPPSSVDLDLPPPPQQTINSNGEREVDNGEGQRGKKKELSSSGRGPVANKRPRRSSPTGHSSQSSDCLPQSRPKPDANMCLKPYGLQYTFGVCAWKHWVTGKNAELEKNATSSSGRKPPKLFKTDILQLTADELNYALSLFVKEARKPNGTEYPPDTIYYLCLGIQQHLYQNGRIDNIFTDAFYDKFTDQLDEVAKIFGNLFNDRQYIETRVLEEHLWETKQLGVHSPYTLLNTLMYFNTKYFNLTTVEEHMQLSFSHIMKNWKRSNSGTTGTQGGGTPNTPKAQGSRNILLRFYPPQTSSTNSDTDQPTAKKKKVYEQQENEENSLRCPVRLYEFYLQKCPESVKSRNDVFYLLPERSCVPDSPVWYSTRPLFREPLSKMLNRIKLVKEVNVALLSAEGST